MKKQLLDENERMFLMKKWAIIFVAPLGDSGGPEAPTATAPPPPERDNGSPCDSQ
jgi:hypothetical protein